MNFADNNILLLLISLVFIYATLSILVSILIDWWDNFYGKRGEFLQQSLVKLLNDPSNPGFGLKIYDNFIIKGLSEVENKLPRYIAPNTFADALIETIIQDVTAEAVNGSLPTPQQLAVRFQTGVGKLPDGELKKLLQSFIDRADGDYDGLRKQIEGWFNTAMQGVSTTFKTIQRRKSLVFGFIIAIALNVDSLHLIKVLSLDDDLKQKLVENAEVAVQNYEGSNNQIDAFVRKQTAIVSADSTKRTTTYTTVNGSKLKAFTKDIKCLQDTTNKQIAQLDSAMTLVSMLNVPIGWNCNEAPLSWLHAKNTPYKIAGNVNGNASIIKYMIKRNSSVTFRNFFLWFTGIIISGFSLSFGAPFWYDILAKLINFQNIARKK